MTWIYTIILIAFVGALSISMYQTLKAFGRS